MPELPITSDKGDLLPDAPTRTLAIMLFPSNRDQQQRVLDGGRVHSHLYDGISAMIETQRRFYAQGGPLNFDQSALGPQTAGELLLLIYQLSRLAPQHASKGKALHVMARRFKRENIRGAGETMIRRVWNKFRCVSALWAASIVFPNAWDPPNGQQVDFNRELFLDFLAVCECLGKFGKEAAPEYGGAGYLLDDDTYMPPANLTLPRGEILLPALDNQVVSDLATYSKKSRGNL